MKPLDRLTDMLEVVYSFINTSEDYDWVENKKNVVSINSQIGPIEIFLHYQREGIGSRINYSDSLKHLIKQRLYEQRNITNIFYADGETFLRSEQNRLLVRDWNEARMKLTAKEQYILELQKTCKTERERVDFENNLIQGRFPKAHPADVLTYITSKEFGNELVSYRMQPIFLRYKERDEKDPRFDFLNDQLAKQKSIARKAKPSQTKFEFVSVKPLGRLMVLQPK